MEYLRMKIRWAKKLEKQGKLDQLFDHETCRLLVDEESKKSLNGNQRLSISMYG